jgi:hypothetical protein
LEGEPAFDSSGEIFFINLCLLVRCALAADVKKFVAVSGVNALGTFTVLD